jgi:hypothetical protein
MSWIQENRFAAGLGGITAVAAAGLIFLGVKAGNDYSAAKDEYTAAADEVDTMERENPYPNEANLAGKKKAVTEYKEAVEKLQASFNKFRSPTPPNIEPDAFTEALLKSRDAAAKAFGDVRPNGVELPPEFLLGFEAYATSPARKDATGILTFQLEAMSELAANLAKAAPVKLINIHRPELEEEEGKTFDPKGKSFRALPVELVFNGTEESLRKFLSSLDDSEKFYFVVRSLRVQNEKQTAPTAADGNFATEEETAATDEGGGADPFGGTFVLPGEEEAPADAPAEGDTPAEETPAETPAGDDGVILQRVLGSEKLNVFVRLDVLQFLEAPKAP